MRFARADIGGIIVVAVAIVVTPLLFQGNDYVLGLAGYALSLAIFALSLMLLLALTGEVALGHALYYGLAAYCSSLLMSKHGWSFLPAVAASLVLTAVLATVIGAITLRLSGAYFAIVSWGLSGVAVVMATSLASITGGDLGVFGIPDATIAGLDLQNAGQYVAVVGVALLLIMIITVVIRASVFGLRLDAARLNAKLARSVGAPVYRDRVAIFAISAAMAGLAGCLGVTYTQIVTSDTLSVSMTVSGLLMALLGGTTYIAGPVVGAFFIEFVPQSLNINASWRLIIFAALIIVIMMISPQGLPAVVESGWRRLSARRTHPSRGVNEGADQSQAGSLRKAGAVSESDTAEERS